jgi:peptide/nickel transport system substrate-binding protein/oligopeptide transport system substrate-binding protein
MFHVLEALQSDWAAVGITVEIKRSDWNVFKTAVREGKPDLYYLDWFADYPDGENFLYPLFYSTESMKNRNRFSDPDIDAIIIEIQGLPNNAKRQRLIADANKLIVDAAPWVFLWHSKTIYLTQQWIKGFQPSPIFNANRYMNISKMAPE